jgi:hypothetical protein
VGGNAVQAVFKTYWGSHLMNIASDDGIYCPCPRATLNGLMMCVLPVSGEEKLAFEKYLDRKFRRVSTEEYVHNLEFSPVRSLADDLTDFFPFEEAVGATRLLGDKFELTPFNRHVEVRSLSIDT